MDNQTSLPEKILVADKDLTDEHFSSWGSPCTVVRSDRNAVENRQNMTCYIREDLALAHSSPKGRQLFEAVSKNELPEKAYWFHTMDKNSVNCHYWSGVKWADSDADDAPSTSIEFTHWLRPLVVSPQSDTETDKCETGCKVFTGGERYHHRDCVFYPESMSKMYDELRAGEEAHLDKIKSLEEDNKRLRHTMNTARTDLYMLNYSRFAEMGNKEPTADARQSVSYIDAALSK